MYDGSIWLWGDTGGISIQELEGEVLNDPPHRRLQLDEINRHSYAFTF